MQNNTPATLYFDNSDYVSSSQQPEDWENYLQFDAENNYTYPPMEDFSEIMFIKPQEAPEPMEEEDIYPNFDRELEFFDYPEKIEQAHFEESETTKGMTDQENAQREDEASECSRCHSDDEMEEVGSISTRDTLYAGFTNIDSDAFSSMSFDENMFMDQTFDLDTDIRTKADHFIQTRPDEEKQYIQKVMPLLISSIKEICQNNQLPVTNEMVASMLKELLYGRELMIGAERQVLRGLVEEDMEDMRSSRPNSRITDEDLTVHKRKEKVASKGNKNTSSLNHLNENYVSNIFQFAKRNYPEDKEVQRLGNERNVSALNFRNRMAPKLTDNILTRQAKSRIVGNGKELVGNIEYWMKDGYFDQCADREKYIYHKEKALRDLALSGQY